MVSLVRSYVSEETLFDNICYYSKCTCVRCKHYIVSLDAEKQGKKRRYLKFCDKNANFMQISIPVIVFKAYLYLMQGNSLKIIFSECTMLIALYLWYLGELP